MDPLSIYQLSSFHSSKVKVSCLNPQSLPSFLCETYLPDWLAMMRRWWVKCYNSTDHKTCTTASVYIGRCTNIDIKQSHRSYINIGMIPKLIFNLSYHISAICFSKKWSISCKYWRIHFTKIKHLLGVHINEATFKYFSFRSYWTNEPISKKYRHFCYIL